MSERRPNSQNRYTSTREAYTELRHSGWDIFLPGLSQNPYYVEVKRVRHKLSPSEAQVRTRFGIELDEQDHLPEGYFFWFSGDGSFSFGYTGSDAKTSESLITDIINFGKELNEAEEIIRDVFSANGELARLVVDSPGTIYEPHSHSATVVYPISGRAKIKIGDSNWKSARNGTFYEIGEDREHEAIVGDKPWVYVVSASREEFERQGLL